MKRVKFCLILISVLVIGCILLWVSLQQPVVAAKEWLYVSNSSLITETNRSGLFQAISFVVSNQSTRGLHFSPLWFECRAKSSLVLWTNAYGPTPSIRLPGGGSTRLTIALPANPPQNEEYLFCCMLTWQEGEPVWWRAGRKFEPWVSKTLFVLDTQAVPPWQQGKLAFGETFTSNMEVAGYFRLAYGFTRSKWLEEIERTKMASTNALFRRRYGQDVTPEGITPQAQLENHAREAFSTFCYKSEPLHEKWIKKQEAL